MSGKSSDGVGDFANSNDPSSCGLCSFEFGFNSGTDSTFELATSIDWAGFIKVLLKAISFFEIDLAPCEFRITKRQRARINSPTAMLYGRLFLLIEGAGFALSTGSPTGGDVGPVEGSGLTAWVAVLVLVLELAVPPTIFGWTFFIENRTGTSPTPTPCG